MGDNILSVKNVTKVFNNKIIVNNISFNIEEGQIFGLLGPSGSGKTVVMRMICGFTHISNGDIFICNNSITTNQKSAFNNLGAYIESPKFYNSLSGFSNLKIFANLLGIKSKNKIYNCAEVVGLLKSDLKKKVRTYSIGMKQKLGIAQALLNDPKLLVFDKPLKGLKPAEMDEIRSLLKYIAKNENVAILISSHMIGEMEKLCDVIAIMNNGRIDEVNSVAELQSRSDNSKKIKITVDYPNFAGKVIINELKYKVNLAGNSILVYTDEENLNSVINTLVNYDISIFNIEFISKSLAQIFDEIIQKKQQNKNWLE